MKRFTVVILLLTAAVFLAAAEFHAPDFRFTHLTTDNGLPSNRVRDIIQDNEGFMWFATEAGLVRYDGTATKVFIPFDDKSLASETFILSLCKNGDRLLVGTDRALYVYFPEKEKMLQMELSYAPGIQKTLVGAVIDICVDSTGYIWAAVDNKGIFRISKEGSVEAVYEFPDFQNQIGMIYVDPNDVVWCVSNINEGGVYRFARNYGKFEKFPITVNGNPVSLRARAIVADGNNNFYLGTWENGILRFNPRSGEASQYSSLDSAHVWHIHSMAFYSPTAMLIGSDSGMILIDVNTGEWKRYADDELNANSLNDRFVYPITLDSEGGLWIGTFYRGVNYQGSSAQRFRRWRHSRFANSVSGNVVARLCEDKFGNIWVGTADGGLCRFNPESSIFTPFPLDGSSSNDNINAICPDGDRLWVGTYSKGVGTLDIKSGKWRRIPVNCDNASSCYAICKDANGRIWIGATETFALYNPDSDSFDKIKDLNAWIFDIDRDREGNLWIATQGRGIYKYTPSSGKWINYVASSAPGSLPHNDINSIKIDPDNNIYVSTLYGVYTFDPERDQFSKVETGLPGMVATALEKNGNELWIATVSGLVNLKADGKARVYTSADGLSDNQFVPGASLLASDGMIYYGTVNGFCMVNPFLTRSATHGPKVKFTGLDIINSPVEVGDSHLPKSLNSIDRLVLTHADHTFSVYFSALSYSGGASYRYRLDGFDKTWIDPGKENRATYSNLPPGSYTLRVKAADPDGVWNDEGVALRIVVEPAWYATAFMKALYVILALALLLFVVRLIVKRMERDHLRELERISDNNQKEMFRSKLSFFTIVAHEIRTPVSLIIGPLEKVMESADSFSPTVKDDLNIINRNARRLLSLVNQLLDFKKVEDNPIPVGFRSTKIVPLVESVADRFRPSVEHRGGTLSVSCPDPDFSADVDTEALTKLVSNLLNNARKFTRDEIHLECRPLPDGKNFMISVSDNGIGISKENRDKVFKPFFQVLDNINESKGGTGLGLSIVKSVVDAHHGSIVLDSAPGKGARFIVTLPLRQQNVLPEEMHAPEDNLQKGEEELSNPVGNSKPVLLVVDDNKEMVDFISSNFSRDYDIVTAENGKEALARMKEKPVEMIISDWMMPVMDGVALLKAVRENENFSHIPFVMLTAKTDNISKIETMRSGADAYVEKPFSIGFLEARIKNLLEMRELLRRKYTRSPIEPIASIAPTPLDNELLQKIQKLIEENISNADLNVDFLVEHIGIGRSSLYSKIKTLADISPNELIQLTRLKKGAELLREGKYRVNEVSYMVGFSSTSYFSRCFHKQFGIKPNEYIAETQKE